MSTAYHSLAGGALTQNWANAGLITVNDDWSAVPSIQGFLGDIDAGSPADVDPRTLTADATGALDVNANQANPNTFTSGGVAEFAIADPVVALQGSGTADAPSLVLYLDATGRQDIVVQFNARDVDGAVDNAAQQLNVQYRLGASGAWTNVTGGYIADATTGPSLATQATPVSVTLPGAANNQAQVQVRILTTNATGSDEWVGIDDIDVSSSVFSGGPDVTPPSLVSSTPADNATNVVSTADVMLNFSETVQAGTGDITITDGAADTRVITLGAADPDGTVTFNGASVTINPTNPLAASTAYDVVIGGGVIQDLANIPFAGIALNELDFTTAAPPPPVTAIYTIQGAGHISAFVGQSVTTQGVVTAVDSNGFYVQDATGDGNINTSDGIFVFTSSAPSVSVGRLVQVTGQVTEFIPGGAAAGSRAITEIVSPTVTDLGVGSAIAATQIGGTAGRKPPTTIIDDAGSSIFDATNHGNDFFESLEGMLVRVNNPVAVSPTNNFGEVFTIVDSDDNAANGLNTNSLTARGGLGISGGTSSFGNTNTVGGDFNPERVQIDDDSGLLAGFTTPLVNVGASLGNVTGVVSYGFGNYEILATAAYSVVSPGNLAPEVTDLVGSAARLTIGNYNVENLDPADDAAKFTQLAQQIIANLRAPDILTLQEIQDNNGATNDAVISAQTTLQMLVDTISAASGGTVTYAFQDNPFIADDVNGGEPGGNIRNAFLYRTDRGVDLIESSLKTISATGAGTTAIGTNADAANPFNDSRLPLVADFTFNGQTITVINNHFSSKGGSGALMGDQPPFNSAEDARAEQAQAVNNFVDTLLASNPKARVVVSGDLNEFEFEEPMRVLEGSATYQDGPDADLLPEFTFGGGVVLNALVATLPTDEQYDYVFDGNSQSLDHMYASAQALKGAVYDIVHMNAEFANQASDHDALVGSFDMTVVSAYSLQVLHYYGESGLLGTTTAARMGALIDKFDDQYANTLVLGEGDSFIPGPWLVGGADPSLNAVPGIGNTALGRPDIAIMNAFGTDASALGNHEFDLGSPTLQAAFVGSGSWVGAQFPFITANLNFSADGSLRGIADASLGGTASNAFAGKEVTDIKAKIAPYAVSTQGGEKIGIIGATTYDLLAKTSPNGTVPKDDGNLSTSDLQEVAAYIQAAVDALRAVGVNKIVMVDQLDTIERNKLLAPLVNGIDVMVAGGGHERLGDANDTAVGFNGHTADFADTYPIVTAGSDGKPTLIVTTDTEYTYLGRLVVDFDAQGNIILGNLDNTVNGAYAATEASLQQAYGTNQTADQIVAGSGIGAKVDAITDAINAVVIAKDSTVWGYTDVYMEGDRAFGRAQEVNLGDVTADANLFVAQTALPTSPFMTSLKNGGGIRASIGAIDEDGTKIPTIANPSAGKPAGGISTLDIENALRFDNKLMVFDTTPAGLKVILEHGAGLAPGNGGYPQLGGLRISYDPDFAAGSRVRNVSVIDLDGNVVARVIENGAISPDAPATIQMVSLNFTANGGDGYPVKANAENFRYIQGNGTLSGPISEALDFTAVANVPANALGEQVAFQRFLQEFHATPDEAYSQADTPASQDVRIENLNVRATDVVFLGSTVNGTIAANDLDGTAGNDTIKAGDGDDDVSGKAGPDAIDLGTGADLLHDTLAHLRGDTIAGFGLTDTLLIEGERFARSDAIITRSATSASITLDGDTFNFTGDFTNGDFMFAADNTHAGDGTLVTFEPFLPALAPRAPVSPGVVNGITNPPFLTGDGETEYVLEFQFGASKAKDMLGYYEVAADGQIGETHILFTNTAKVAPGTAIDIGVPENGTQLGFFVIADGAKAYKKGLPDDLSFRTSASGPLADLDTGDVPLLVSASRGVLSKAAIYHSFDTLNHGNAQAVLSGVVPGGQALAIAFEDAPFQPFNSDFYDVAFNIRAVHDTLV